MSHAGGRPAGLNGHTIAEATEYVEGPDNDHLANATKYLQECADKFTKRKTQVNLPTIEGLAYHLNISRSTLYEWGKQNPAFAHILERLQQKQAIQLINESLAGRYKSSKTVGMLLSKHGYYESTTTEHSGMVVSRKMSDEELDAIIERAERRKASEDTEA